MPKRLVLILLSAFVVTGCVKYDERIELKADGSGVVRMHLAIAEQVMPPSITRKTGREEDLFPMPREQLVKDLEKDGFKVMSLRAESTRGMRHFFLVLAFENLDVLRKSEWFGGRKVVLRKIGAKWQFDQEISVSKDTLTRRSPVRKIEKPKKGPDGKPMKRPAKQESVVQQLERRFGKARVKEMLRNYRISFSVRLTGAGLLATNGRNHNDHTAVWSIPLSELIGKKPTINMSAEFASAERSPAAKE